jgi:hypothetical protein
VTLKASEKKAAAASFKERKTVAGLFAVRCAASGQLWVGTTPNLETVQNQLWFTLRHGNHPARTLQDAWRTHGGASFTFEQLERLEGEDTQFFRAARLRDRATHWRTELGGLPL